MKTVKYIFLTLMAIGLTSASAIYAQGELPSEQIEVVKDFDARLIDAQKLIFSPGILAADTSRRAYSYNVSTEVPPIEYLEPSLKPLALKSVSKPQVYRGLARAGYGIPRFALGDAFYQLAQSDDLQVGIGLSHSSAHNRDFANQRYMDNDGSIIRHMVCKPYGFTQR